MFKVLVSVLFVVISHPVLAQSCPAFYRFVDFGVQSSNVDMLRGGTIFRAFDGNGAHLLNLERTVCRAVDDLARDGRGFEIPVVAGISFKADELPDDFIELSLFVVKDVQFVTDAGAAVHRRAVEQAGDEVIRGDAFLCVFGGDPESVSCQVVSPYGARVAPVVYCGAVQCEVPVMMRDAQIGVRAVWHRHASDSTALGVDRLGIEIFRRLEQIHDMIEEQI